MSTQQGRAILGSSDSMVKFLGLAFLSRVLGGCPGRAAPTPVSSSSQCSNAGTPSGGAVFWPDGKRAAVSLKYNDALVGGEYLQVELEPHEALLQARETHKGRVWTEQFGKVAAYVREKRK